MIGDGGSDGHPALREGRATQPVKSRLRRLDLDDDEVNAGGCGQDHPDIANVVVLTVLPFWFQRRFRTSASKGDGERFVQASRWRLSEPSAMPWISIMA